MIKAFLVILAIASALIMRAEVYTTICESNMLKVITFIDTVFDPELPKVEILHNTYNNMDSVTTAGFKVILRGGEIKITGADLYKASSKNNINKRMKTLAPLQLHLGDSTKHNVIQHAYVYPHFAFTTMFYEEDSLVVHTNKGDKTIYLMEGYRQSLATKEKTHALEASNHTLKNMNHVLYALLFIIVAGYGLFMLRLHRRRVQEEQERERLLAIISENEMNKRVLKEAVTNQFRKNFETINRLCYEYFEFANSPALKKNIYTQVENEINKLKTPSRLKELEASLNQYCDNIMARISDQLPELNDKERMLLLYLYSGLSARTICILTGIQVKNFYMRRQRLKSKILASSAPDRLNFTELM